jgi:peroxiredoxin
LELTPMSQHTPHDPLHLPSHLPRPKDDGAAAHLIGRPLPVIALPAIDGSWVDLSTLPGRTVVYCYPRTGRPDQPPPAGWDAIPGARGCTPQSCGFRDHHAELAAEHARVFGLSSQDTAYQREAARRLRLPFPLLSDAPGCFTAALRLPTFEADGMALLRRLTLIVRDGAVEHVRYPVFPPDADAAEVLAWLRAYPLPAAANR